MKYRCLGCVIISLVVCMRYNQPSIWAPHTTSILLFSILLILHRPLLLINKLPHRNKQTINQSIIATTHEPPPTDRQPNDHKIFLLPMSRLTCFHPTSATQNSSTISHRIPILNYQPVGVLKIFPDPDYDDEDCEHPHYLGAEACYARGRTNSQEARRNSCHLHLHQVVMWGRIMLLHVAVWGGMEGQPNFISSLTLCCCHNNHNTKNLVFALWRDPPFLSKIRRMSWVPFYFTKQISQSSFSSIFPRFLVCTKVQACATHVPKVPEFIF